MAPESHNGKSWDDRKSDKEYERLLRLARESEWRQFTVSEIRVLFCIPEKRLTTLRKLAQRDLKSDPWDGDRTLPAKFHQWFWGKRIELENTPEKKPESKKQSK